MNVVLSKRLPARKAFHEHFIATGERRAFSYLFKPLTDGLERAPGDE